MTNTKNNSSTSAEDLYFIPFNKENLFKHKNKIIKVPGIYLLKCLDIDKIYIGQSKSLYDRLCKHLSKRSGSMVLHDFQEKYSNWEFSILESGEHLRGDKKRSDVEIYYISLFNSFLDGLNRHPGGAYVPEEAARNAGKLGGAATKSQGKGIFALSEDERKEIAAKSGRTCVENNLGYFKFSPEEKKQFAIMAGKATAIFWEFEYQGEIYYSLGRRALNEKFEKSHKKLKKSENVLLDREKIDLNVVFKFNGEDYEIV